MNRIIKPEKSENTYLLVMPVPCAQVINPLRYRENKHHREDGHGSEALKREWHIKDLITYLDKVRLNLFHSYPHINIFP
jgi:hypothetical protein